MKNMHKQNLLIPVLGLCLFIFTGCDVASLFGPFVSKLPDSRFNGSFTYFHYWIANESTEYTSLDFDGTTKVWFYTKYSSYYSGVGWIYSGDYLGDYYAWYYEFEVNNNQYRCRLWDNDYDDWTTWETYSFSPDGNTLTLNDWYNISGNDLVLEKD